eukprot:gene28010-31107_t
MKLIAVPLFDLYDNGPRYGPVIASIPAVSMDTWTVVLSRYRLNLIGTTLPPTISQPPADESSNALVAKSSVDVHA